MLAGQVSTVNTILCQHRDPYDLLPDGSARVFLPGSARYLTTIYGPGHTKLAEAYGETPGRSVDNAARKLPPLNGETTR